MEDATQQQETADLNLKVAGQEVNIRNIKSVNTILTTGAFIAACFGVYLLMQHQVEAKQGANAFMEALKEHTSAIRAQTAASREQTCIMRFDQKERQQNAEFCKSIAGAK